jgi:hypothetical protein
VTVDYSSFSQAERESSTIRDVFIISGDLAAQSKQNSFQSALSVFLGQFKDTENRWVNHYEPETLKLISHAARLQESIVSEMPCPPTDFSTEATAIALALNCFAVLHDLDDVPAHYPGDQEGDDVILEEARVEENNGKQELIPFMRIEWKEGPAPEPCRCSSRSGWDPGAPAGKMLQHLSHLTWHILGKRDPKDWPTVLYVLCILQFICKIDQLEDYWTDCLRPGLYSVRGFTSDLCRLYYISTDGGYPLTFDFEKVSDNGPSPDPREEPGYEFLIGGGTKYEDLAGGNATAIEHYYILLNLWIDGGECAVRQV